jgi:hypothetical protein
MSSAVQTATTTAIAATMLAASAIALVLVRLNGHPPSNRSRHHSVRFKVGSKQRPYLF